MCGRGTSLKRCHSNRCYKNSPKSSLHTLAQGLILIDSAMDSLSRQRYQSDDIYCWSNAYIPQANSLPHQSPHDDSASNQAKEHSKAQKVQGKDGISNGVGGRRGIFVWEDHVATHYLHNFYTISARRIFATHS